MDFNELSTEENLPLVKRNSIWARFMVDLVFARFFLSFHFLFFNFFLLTCILQPSLHRLHFSSALLLFLAASLNLGHVAGTVNSRSTPSEYRC